MTVSIITQFRDEAKYLKEWIEFHLLVGVDKFYMINHLSQDDPHSVLQPYIDKGIVILEDVMIEFAEPQHKTFNNEIKLVHNTLPRLHNLMKNADTSWVMFLNVDEFLYPTEKNNLKDVLVEYPETIGQVSVNWQMMGNSNYELKDGELLTEKLTRCSLNNEVQKHVKSLVRKQAYENIDSVHYCKIKGKYKTSDSNGDIRNTTQEKWQTKTPVYDRLTINHYVFRDLTYTSKKLETYMMWGRHIDGEYGKLYNEHTNTDIQRFIPELKNRMI